MVSASDGTSTSAKTITVNLTDLNDNAPVITTAASQSVAENATLVAALTSTDADTVGTNPASFAITGGADAALFDIVAGNLVFKTAPDFENPIDTDANNVYDVTVQASDGGRLPSHRHRRYQRLRFICWNVGQQHDSRNVRRRHD